MPWWSWIVIWIALVALSLLFFVVLGVRLFRQFMATVKDLGEAGERFSRLPSGAADSGSTEADRVDSNSVDANSVDAGAAAGAHPGPGSAVFASPARMRHDYLTSKLSRQEGRRLRRVLRKADRGQPQSLHDIEFS